MEYMIIINILLSTRTSIWTDAYIASLNFVMTASFLWLHFCSQNDLANYHFLEKIRIANCIPGASLLLDNLRAAVLVADNCPSSYLIRF